MKGVHGTYLVVVVFTEGKQVLILVVMFGVVIAVMVVVMVGTLMDEVVMRGREGGVRCMP